MEVRAGVGTRIHRTSMAWQGLWILFLRWESVEDFELGRDMLCESHSVVSDSLQPQDYTVHGILQARILE